jgi:hypothetical protein
MNEILKVDERLPKTITPCFFPKPHKIIIEKTCNSLIFIGAKNIGYLHISSFLICCETNIDRAVIKAIEVIKNNPDYLIDQNS